MPIDIACDECTKRFRVEDQHAGKRIRCPDCSAILEVPARRRKKHPPRRSAPPAARQYEDEYDDPWAEPQPPRPDRRTGRRKPPRQQKSASGGPNSLLLVAGGAFIGLSALAFGAAYYIFDWGTSDEVVIPDRPDIPTLPGGGLADGGNAGGFVPAAGSAQPEATGAVAAFERVQPSVVHLQSMMSSGTGILLNEQGLILTNAHVVSMPLQLRCHIDALTADGRLTPLAYEQTRVIAVHPVLDLALVIVNPAEHRARLRPATIVWKKARPGEQVYAVGNPSADSTVSLTKTITEGLISGVDRQLEGVNYYQISAAINPGNSGGPLVDETGKVLGVVTLKLDQAENVGFVIPIYDLNLAQFVPPAKREADRATSDRFAARGRTAQNEYLRLKQKGQGETLGAQVALAMAVESYELSMSLDPSNWLPYLQMGRILAELEEEETGQQLIRYALELAPWNHVSAYEAYGHSLKLQGRSEDAVAVWYEGVARFPLPGAPIWNRLAEHYVENSEWLQGGLCAAAGLYSAMTQDTGTAPGHLSQLLAECQSKLTGSAEFPQLSKAILSIDEELARMHNVARTHSSQGTVAMRPEFLTLARKLSLDLSGQAEETSRRFIALNNSVISNPPPGMRKQQMPDAAAFLNARRSGGTELLASAQPVLPTGNSPFSAAYLNSLTQADGTPLTSSNLPPWLIAARAGLKGPIPPNFRPGSRLNNSPGNSGSAPATPNTPESNVYPAEVVLTATSPDAQDRVQDLVVSRDGKQVLVNTSRQVLQWEPSGPLKWRPFGQGAADELCGFSHDGKRAVTSANGQTLVWDTNNHEIVQAIQTRSKTACISRSGERLATSSGGADVVIWSLQNGQKLGTLRTGDVVQDFGILPDDNTLISVSSSGKAIVFDAATKTARESKVEGTGFSDGDVAADAQRALVRHMLEVDVVDCTNGEVIYHRNYTTSESLVGAALSADGNTLLAVSSNFVRITDLSGRTSIRSLEVRLPKRLYGNAHCDLSGDGSRAFLRLENSNRVDVWDLRRMWRDVR